MAWFAAAFIAAVAVLTWVQRKNLAEMQAAVLGGSVVPGCVVAEAVALLLIAMAIAAGGWMGLF